MSDAEPRPGGRDATPPGRAGAPGGTKKGGRAKGDGSKSGGRRERKAMLLRLDPALHDALTRWAADELRSTNAHIEWLLKRAVKQAGRIPD
jgi:hypothetical protein